MPKMTVAARVKASYVHFDMLRDKAREIKARFEQEDDEIRQVVRPPSPSFQWSRPMSLAQNLLQEKYNVVT